MKKLFFILQVTGLFIFCLDGTAAAQKCTFGDCQNGIGKYVDKDGDTYEGDFVKGKKEGSGTLIYAAGGKYIGEFKDGALHGYGIKTYKGGDVYQGDFIDGLRHGKGTYTFTDGDYYEGEYFKGERHGSGKLYTKKTNSFKIGIWKDGKYVPDSAPAVQTTAKLSDGEVWKRQVAYAEDIAARLDKIKLLGQNYSTKLPPAEKKRNLEARKTESTAINAIANKAMSELGDQLTADSKQFFTARQTEAANNIKAYDAMLALVTMGEKDAKAASGFLDQVLPTNTTTPKISTPATVAVSAASANPNNEGRELFQAVATNNTTLALELIKKGSNVHYRSWSNPPEMSDAYKYISLNTLAAAARNKNLVLAKALLDGGADPNARINVRQETALFIATEIEMPEMVELFLRYKADPNLRTESDWTPLHSAAVRTKGDGVVRLLLAAGANPNVYSATGKSPLAYAKEGDDKAMAETLSAASSADVRSNPTTTKIPTSPLGTFSVAPPVYSRKPRAANAEELARELWKAVKAQNRSEVIRLINAGAEVNWRLGDTPILKEAVDTYDIQMVQALLEAGADPNMRDLQYGMSALHEAVSYVNIDMVKLLLRYKGDPNITTKDGRTALHMASIWNSSDKITAVLIDAGANPNAIDSSNRTAKSIAVSEKRIQIVNLIDKALAQKTYAAGVRVASEMPQSTESTSNNYAREAAMREYEIVHGRIHENMQRYINNYNKYAKADPRLRSMMGGTVLTMNQAKDGALSMIDELLKKHGNNLPKDVRDHLREDAGKFISLPM
jgi:ankyrin repeat protein